jgi:bifunctional non-homologous end joining protein LigD
MTLTAMLLQPGAAVPDGDFAMEPKHDGVRVLNTVDAAGVRRRSRHGTDLSGLAPAADDHLRHLPSGSVLDGELVAFAPDADGRVVHDFASVRHAVFTRRPSTALSVAVWDVLVDAGRDVRALPWETRRERLDTLLQEGPAVMRSPLLTCTAESVEHLIAAGWEGAVVKARGSRYRCGQRTAAWRKFKGRHETRGEIIGHGQPEADGGEVVVRYARRDADGSPRDARLVGA